MRNLFACLLSLFIFCFSAMSQNNVTFQVDMNSVDPTTFTTPEVMELLTVGVETVPQ